MVAVAVAPAFVGCEVGDARSGMSGNQLLRAHDVSDVFFANSTTLAFTRRATEPSDERPQDLWSLDMSSGAAPEMALSGIDWAPPQWWPRLRVGELLVTGSGGRRFYDFDQKRATDLLGFGFEAPPAGGGIPGTVIPFRPITAIRRDGGAIAVTGGESNRVGIGRPAELQTFSVEGAVAGLDFLGEDLALLYAPPGSSDATMGIYRMSAASGELTQLVAPTPATDWYQATTTCQPYDTNPCALFKVVGCNAGDSPCPGDGKPPCVILYAKVETKDGVPGPVYAYGYDVGTGGSFWLPGAAPQAFAVSPDQHMIVWQSTVGGVDRPSATVSRFWDLCTSTETICPESQASQVVWRPGGGGFALLDYGGMMITADSASGECKTAADWGIYQAQFSPAGDRLLVLEALNDGVNTQMYTADVRGASFERIATGQITGARFSPDGNRIIAARGDAATVSLSWFDLTASPPAEHRLADNYGGFSRGGARRALLVDHWNSQDASGDLVLLDVASGERHLLGRAVTEFSVLGDPDGADAQVAYVVRSRVASDRDGLWLTALPP